MPTHTARRCWWRATIPAAPRCRCQDVIILVDDSAVLKYAYDLAFYKDGVMVTE